MSLLAPLAPLSSSTSSTYQVPSTTPLLILMFLFFVIVGIVAKFYIDKAPAGALSFKTAPEQAGTNATAPASQPK
jgi:hypothetical protein